MNILYVLLLLICAICHVFGSQYVMNIIKSETSLVPVEGSITSDPKAKQFREAVQNGNMNAAQRVFDNGSSALKKYCSEHLVSLGSPKLIQLVEDERGKNREWMLHVLLVYADESFYDEVFRAVNIPNSLSSEVANSADVACIPQRFTYLLRRIDYIVEQEQAVRKGIVALFASKKTECIDPLLSALKKEKFLSPDLEGVAIRQIFYQSSIYQDENDDRAFFVGRLFDHPAVSSAQYSVVLFRAARLYPHLEDRIKELFHWLLENADSQDLNMVKSDGAFSSGSPEFQDAVDEALQTVSSEPRHGITLRRKAIVHDALSTHLAIVLINIINEYVN